MPGQMGTTVDFNDAKVIFNSADHAGLHESDLRWRLMQTLQTTLEIETLFKIFFEQIHDTVPFDGFTYQLELLKIDFTLGKKALHSCNYRLVTQHDFLGELTFYSNKRFPERDLAVLEGLLNSMVFPLRNAIRYKDAVTAALADPLTGAGNRIALNNTLQREIEMAKRYAQTMAVLMIDLDHFKYINDTFGHQCGDQVLKAMVLAIEDEIRGSDVVFRYGGEEFVVLLNKSSAEDAEDIAERVRQRIRNLKVEHAGNPVDVSVSIGISMLHPEDTVMRLLERADFAMYLAKNSGRNQVKTCCEKLAEPAG